MPTLCVNDKEYSFEYQDTVNALDKALKEHIRETGEKPWGFIMGIQEYASLVLYLKNHYLGDTSKPSFFNDIPCFPHRDYEGKIITLNSFESQLLDKQ